ncbi:ABC-type transport system, substrate-binding protein [Actinopolymorpha cephalotaxi]|uniref:ABC-type transport system, substrate-binding protein n=1 Tax=Actinopolymorpha cephalotaxi TaxID=504797 RepID=A0A1I2X1L7_9ACTN|nr:ABC transporter substrate-binding protein [Actinopolymorpha cephalotaxi]NYH85213.1 peptide/nickel transport system substrate-binding protein [Actinopolymorpha cephalotaxi]SFH06566.1 ABC-type transport system, substrate-binding protein [Actinopolymorpha cephalotaxi]
MRTSRSRRAAALGAVAAALTLVVGACSGEDAGGGGGGAHDVGKATGSAVVDPAKYPATQTAFRIANPQWSSGVSYNPYSPNPEPFLNLSLINLAAYSNTLRPGSNPYLPEMASSWKVDGHQITFDLRQGAKWQDGKPFTTKDVIDSFLLAGANGSSVWADIEDLSAPNDHQVTVKLHDWVVTDNVMSSIMSIWMLPSTQYGSLLPAGFDKALLSYWHTYNFLDPTQASIKAASDSPAGKAVLTTGTNLAKFKPDKLIGNGPYTIQNSGVSGILFRKWMGWWDQKNIRVPWVQIVPASVTAAFGGLSGGTMDFEEFSQFTDPQVDKLKASGTGHYVFIPSPVQQESLVFHLATYPYNLREVRQAFAYIIKRKQLTQLDMGGKLIQDPPAIAPDGINDAMAVPKYITRAQMAKMNPYNYNPAKAKQLLESVGFTKKNGKWYTPKGDLWKVTITEEAGNSQFDQDGLAIANMLMHFGIKAEEVNVNSGTYYNQMLDGQFAVTEWFMDWGGTPNPLADFAATFAQGSLPAWNYPIWYDGKGEFHGHVAIGVGPYADVPGLGKVHIAATLNRQVNQAPKSKWAEYTYDWARWINRDLPILPLYNNAFHEAYGTSRYTKFPPDSEKWLWTGLGGAAQPVMWMQSGYLQMKSGS